MLTDGKKKKELKKVKQKLLFGVLELQSREHRSRWQPHCVPSVGKFRGFLIGKRRKQKLYYQLFTKNHDWLNAVGC